MKSFILSFCLICFSSVLTAQIVTIPDANLKQALVDYSPTIDTNNDGEIQVSEALEVSQLILNNLDISDMTGIEEFLNLTQLYCGSNPLTTIDVSSNVNLLQLGVYYTDISTLDISQNTNLYTLRMYNTLISEIDVSIHPNLEMISASHSSLASIDVSNNPNLMYLAINNTNVQSIDLSVNTNLEFLNLLNIDMDITDFSFLPNLKMLYLGGNNIESYHLADNPQLCTVFLKDNFSLESVNLQNGTNELLLPNGPCSIEFTYGGVGSTSGLYAHNNNPVLETICVDDVDFAETNFVLIPPQTIFIDECNLSIDDSSFLEVNYYPNPMTEFLNIRSSSFISEVKVYSILGEEVLSANVDATNFRLDVRNLASGTYFVNLESSNTSEVFQVIKK